MAKGKAGSGSNSDDKRRRLSEELSQKLGQIDEEGLQFLNKQADILIYNQKVDELNRKIRQTVKPAAFAGPKIEPDHVSIERTKDDFFHISVGGTRVFFNLEEMRALTRIAHGAQDAEAGARRLYRWFSRERQDFLNDTGMGSPSSPQLKRLHRVIINTYKVKKT